MSDSEAFSLRLFSFFMRQLLHLLFESLGCWPPGIGQALGVWVPFLDFYFSLSLSSSLTLVCPCLVQFLPDEPGSTPVGGAGVCVWGRHFQVTAALTLARSFPQVCSAGHQLSNPVSIFQKHLLKSFFHFSLFFCPLCLYFHFFVVIWRQFGE